MNEMADKHMESSRIEMEDDMSSGDEKMIESEDEESFFRDEGNH